MNEQGQKRKTKREHGKTQMREKEKERSQHALVRTALKKKTMWGRTCKQVT